MDQVYKYKIWTNVFLLIPMMIAFSNHLYFYSIILPCLFVSSILFHTYREKKFEMLDRTLVLLLMGTNLFYIYLGHFKYPYFYLALISVVLAFRFYFLKNQTKGQYNIHHGTWHIFGAIITIFSMLTFLY